MQFDSSQLIPFLNKYEQHIFAVAQLPDSALPILRRTMLSLISKMIEQSDKLSLPQLDFCVKYLTTGITTNEKQKEHSC